MAKCLVTPRACVYLLLGLSIGLTGCANTYQISTFDGHTFESSSTPVLTNGAYEFEMADSQPMRVPYVLVKSVNPS
jgi:hypothetical protein